MAGASGQSIGAIGSIMRSHKPANHVDVGEKQPVRSLNDWLKESNVFDVSAALQSRQANAYNK